MNSNQQTHRETLAGVLVIFLLLSSSAVVAFEQAAGGSVREKTDAQSAGLPGAAPVLPTVLVELFTSEGCSSCPPADKVLAGLDQNQPVNGAEIIALSEHVDYWNLLGWRDPVSSAHFSQRQSEYARAFGIEDIYTPQMVVDGRAQFVGSKLAPVLDEIAKSARSPKANVMIAIKTSVAKSTTFTVRVEGVPDLRRGDKADVMLALAESGLLSKVSRGENSGRDLTHSAVTRKLIKIGAIDDRSFSAEPTVQLNSEWKRKDLKAVAFVQERTSRRVLGAAAVKIDVEL